MKKPAQIIEIFLQPGDFYFGDRNTHIRTLLGSCISITLWHPQLLIGGMCHFMVPSRGKQPDTVPLDGHYADEALELFRREIRAAGTLSAEYEVKLFGGSNMFTDSGRHFCPNKNCLDPFTNSCRDVSCRNQRSARLLVERHGFTVKAERLGGTKPHNVLFDLWSGNVWIKRPPKILKCQE
ncbi:MAG: chemotaxis protein CheD [Sulfuricella sp.]|nr:chemotaxis protein CheD [Sulfuricella sp.]